MTTDQKLDALRKAWGYVEVSQATVVVSGWKIWLAKNYKGRAIRKMSGRGLPGNPRATVKIEYAGSSPKQAINNAYRCTVRNEMKQKKNRRSAA